MTRKTFDLEDRLINFYIASMELVEALPTSIISRPIAGQLSLSALSPALNYGEAQAAESTKDFLHKMKICLEELRETRVCLNIISRKPLLAPEVVGPVLEECGQLKTIFITSIRTKERNLRPGKSGNNEPQDFEILCLTFSLLIRRLSRSNNHHHATPSPLHP